MGDRLFTQSAQNALNKALYIARELGHTYIGSEHILLGLLSVENSVAAKLLALRGITEERTRELVIQSVGRGEPSNVSPEDRTPRTKRIIEIASYQALKFGHNYIGTEHILLALLTESDCVGVKLIAAQNVNPTELQTDVLGFFRGATGEDVPDANIGTAASNGGQPGGAGYGGMFGGQPYGGAKTGTQSAGTGNMPMLKQYGRDLTEMAAAGKLDPIIGRDAETERVIQILSRRTKNNPCLIGEPGVGKTAVVEGLAQRIIDGNVPETLAGRHIVTLDISGMLAGSKYRGEFEERMKGVMAEVIKNPGVVLFIDEIHNIIGAGAAEGAVDAANILKPVLARGEMQIIGATTIDEYRKHIEKDAALERRFQSVMVGEPSPSEAEQILFGLRDKYEAHHKLKISDAAIRAAVKLSVRYIGDRYLPDKAIDLIDEAASRLRIKCRTAPPDLKALEDKLRAVTAEKEAAIKAQDFERAASIRDEEKRLTESLEKAKSAWETTHDDKNIIVGEDDIAEIVTAWTGIPVKKLAQEESQRLLHLDDILKQRVIDQDEAVNAVARAIRRGRVGLKDPKRPMGSFIFLGPTGVGKTELSKALAEVLFGSENAMIRVDMSEYMEKHSISKMIGSPPGYVGYDEGGQLTEKIRRHPYSVVLFDEIEKAHPDVFNIMLQVLEDGILTDAQGRRVDFKNTVIIMTSNVGAQNIVGKRSVMGFNSESEGRAADHERVKAAVMGQLKETFRPEFLNRVDEVIVFNKLTDEDIKKICRIMLAEIAKRIGGMGVSIAFTDEVVDMLAREGIDDVYGARPLRREIQRRIEDAFASEMLEGNFTAGDSVEVRLDESGKLMFGKVGKTSESETAKNAEPHKGAGSKA